MILNENEIRAGLIGSWILVEWQISYPSPKRIVWPFGHDAIGLLVYASDGWMSASMSRRERGDLSGELGDPQGDHSRAQAFSDYLSYAGRWWIDGNTVKHAVNLSMHPSLLNTIQVRQVEFNDATLILGALEIDPKGRKREHHIFWVRADDQSLA